MPFLLVLIRKSRWLGSVPQFRGLPDIPADCLLDLRTEGNELSAWSIDNQKANLNRVIAALAANRDTVSNLDYLLFDSGLIQTLNIKVRNTPGVSPDSYANRTWHNDLTALSARQIAQLAVDIHSSGTKDRVSEKRVRQLIEAGVRNVELDSSKFKSQLYKKVFGRPESRFWSRIWKWLPWR